MRYDSPKIPHSEMTKDHFIKQYNSYVRARSVPTIGGYLGWHWGNYIVRPQGVYKLTKYEQKKVHIRSWGRTPS